MVLKRKTVTKVTRSLTADTKVKINAAKADNTAKAKAAKKKNVKEAEVESEEEVSEEEEEEVEMAVSKRPAAAQKKAAEESEDEEEEDEEESEEDEEEEEDDEEEEVADTQIVAVEKTEATDQELVAARAKELKAMPAEALKELIASSGLEKGTKEVMIKTLLKHEAKVHAAALEQKAKIRAVVVKRKQELEALSIPELGKLCNEKGLKGLKSKPERVQRLLVQWQEEDGVDRALNEIAQVARKEELQAMDCSKLQKFCNKLSVDPFVKEIMVERISKHENATGCYARPAIKEEEKATNEAKLDMVDALLANEAQRKKENDARAQQEEALLRKRKEIKALSVEDLKKKLAKKGLEATGKREDMVEALFIAGVQEDAGATRKVELQSKSTQDLKDLLSRNGLEGGSKDQMVKTMLAHEAKSREELKAFEMKVAEEAAKKQKQLESNSNAALKELCESKGLAVKGDKEERIERILEESTKEREFDKVVSLNIRSKRQAELMALDKTVVLKLCEEATIDPFVKDVMVERIMAQESEAGEAIVANDVEPASKKARVSKK